MTYRYFRFNLLTNKDGGNWLLSRLELRTSHNGSNAASTGANWSASGTASPGSPYTCSPASLAAGNTGDIYAIWNVTTYAGQWVQYDFGSATTVVEFMMRGAPYNTAHLTMMPNTFNVQGSNNGTTFTTLGVYTTTWTVQGEAQIFRLDTVQARVTNVVAEVIQNHHIPGITPPTIGGGAPSIVQSAFNRDNGGQSVVLPNAPTLGNTFVCVDLGHSSGIYWDPALTLVGHSADGGTGQINMYTRAVNAEDFPTADSANHRYWRIKIWDNQNHHYLVMGELAFATSNGGTNILTSGNISAGSSNGSYPPTNLLDGNSATFWASGNNAGGSMALFPNTIQCDLGATSSNWQNVVEVRCTQRSDGTGFPNYDNQAPSYFYVQFSDDGTHWTTKWIGNDTSSYSSGSTKNFQYSSPGANKPTFNVNGLGDWHNFGVFEIHNMLSVSETANGTASVSGGTMSTSSLSAPAATNAMRFLGIYWDGNQDLDGLSDYYRISPGSSVWQGTGSGNHNGVLYWLDDTSGVKAVTSTGSPSNVGYGVFDILAPAAPGGAILLFILS